MVNCSTHLQHKYICRSVSLSACLHVCLSVCLSIRPSFRRPACRSVCRSVGLFVVCLSVLYGYISIRLSVFSSSIYFFTHIYLFFDFLFPCFFFALIRYIFYVLPLVKKKNNKVKFLHATKQNRTMPYFVSHHVFWILDMHSTLSNQRQNTTTKSLNCYRPQYITELQSLGNISLFPT